jgi:hypothetical protein
MFTFADYAFWVSETVGYALVLTCIVIAGSAYKWWSVTTYCALQVAINLALFAACWQQAWSVCFYTQWLPGIVLQLLKLAILLQIVTSGLYSLKTAPISLRVTFGISASICASIAFMAGTRGHVPGHSLVLFVLLVNRAVSMAVMGIFAMFSAFSVIIDLKLQPRTLLIDAGLTLMASADLLCYLGELAFIKRYLAFYRVQSALDMIAIAAWCIAFLLSSQESAAVNEARNEMLQIARTEIIQINLVDHRGTR